MEIENLLTQNPVFKYLSDKEKLDLAACAITRDYPKDQWITHYGDQWPYLFILESGAITAMKESTTGRSLIVTAIQPGEIFFGLAFFRADMPMIVALVANEASRVYLWSRDSMVPVLIRNGRVTWELSRSLVLRMQRASDIVEELAFQPVIGRLARLLLEQYSDAVGDYMAREMTLDEMAARIGTTREMVCRQLSRFADQKAISINRTEFMITDQRKLEHLARKGKG